MSITDVARLEEAETSVEVLLGNAARKGPEMREEIQARCIEQEMSFARRVARRYFGRGVAQEDLEQVAFLGLIKAVRRFDPERGMPFRNFASVTIRGEIRRHFRDCAWVVRPPRQLQQLQSEIWDAESDLAAALGRHPTVTEVAHFVGTDAARVEEARSLNRCFIATSLNAPGPFGEGSSLEESLGGPDEGFLAAEMRAVLARTDLGLSSRDRKILELRFVRGCTQRQIGEVLGVSQMQVSRLITRIVRDLQRAVSDTTGQPSGTSGEKSA